MDPKKHGPNATVLDREPSGTLISFVNFFPGSSEIVPDTTYLFKEGKGGRSSLMLFRREAVLK